MASMEVILAKIDERTKYIKERLDEHIEADCTPELLTDVASLKTNVSWIRKLGIGIPTSLAALAAAWKGLIQ